mmetsp:Transcript_28206/g.63587  ORF Transcript_28206/g.63587 Transcript_28206/m.63587 type:complete len:81 (+) Transcript_28206:197-439(+)
MQGRDWIASPTQIGATETPGVTIAKPKATVVMLLAMLPPLPHCRIFSKRLPFRNLARLTERYQPCIAGDSFLDGFDRFFF